MSEIVEILALRARTPRTPDYPSRFDPRNYQRGERDSCPRLRWSVFVFVSENILELVSDTVIFE